MWRQCRSRMSRVLATARTGHKSIEEASPTGPVDLLLFRVFELLNIIIVEMDFDLTNVLELEDCDVFMEREEAEKKFAEKMSSVVAVAGTYIKEKNTIVIAAICKDPNNGVREKLDDYPGDPFTEEELKDIKDLMESTEANEAKDSTEKKIFDLKGWNPSELSAALKKEKKNE
ncbi:hypothetical protein SFRURICE_013944 [Spodoptera frugiperda]|nr:hypothetical protein SFRURICE_013944 [Spodoptera frugiperda]